MAAIKTCFSAMNRLLLLPIFLFGNLHQNSIGAEIELSYVAGFPQGDFTSASNGFEVSFAHSAKKTPLVLGVHLGYQNLGSIIYPSANDNNGIYEMTNTYEVSYLQLFLQVYQTKGDFDFFVEMPFGYQKTNLEAIIGHGGSNEEKFPYSLDHENMNFGFGGGVVFPKRGSKALTHIAFSGQYLVTNRMNFLRPSSTNYYPQEDRFVYTVESESVPILVFKLGIRFFL